MFVPYGTVLVRYRYRVPSVGVLIIYSEDLKLIKQLYCINLRPRGLGYGTLRC